jgi:GT2 family glycosyltransferase
MVERAVRSALAQRRPPAEVIVVDDASGDDTGARAESAGARVVTHDQNRGRGAARNTGLEEAASEWVALLDSDDEWLPDHLATLWPARDDHVLVGAAALAVDAEAQDARVFGWAGRRACALRGPADVAVPENKLVASAVMLRRDEVLRVGGFRTDIERAEDLDLWVRLLRDGSGLAIPRVTVLYHVHEGQITSEPERMWDAHAAVIAAHWPREGVGRSLHRRHEGAIAWDAARAALTNGHPTARSLAGLGRALASPGRAVGVVQLLAGRFRSRRLAGRHSRDGGPSTAILPGAPAGCEAIPGAVDMRALGRVGALARLARRPTARAVAGGRAGELAVRALGVAPVDPPGGDRPA